MKKMQGREKAEEAFLDQGEKPVVVGINTAQAREREKLRNVALFNQALDLSIDQYKEEEERLGQDEDVMLNLGGNNSEDQDKIDKITPLAFTKMVMANNVGGFGASTLFSDVRYTLKEDGKDYAK